jgi:creatinine amidohydrolase
MRFSISIFLILIFFKSTAQSYELPTVHLEELTFFEVKDALNNGVKSVIIPTGGTEPNGPHMVLGKHNFRVKYLAQEIALKLSDAIVAPTIAYVPEGRIDPLEGWMNLPGTIHLPEKYFMKLIEYAARSFKQHGFKDIILIGDSGGNQNGLKKVSESLNLEWKETNVRVHYISEYYNSSSISTVLDSLETEGLNPKDFGEHAGLTDTSRLLAINKELLRLGIMETLEYNDWSIDENRRLGYGGNPSQSSVKIGIRLNNAKILDSVDQINKLKNESRK